jgi:hypothetical protein
MIQSAIEVVVQKVLFRRNACTLSHFLVRMIEEFLLLNHNFIKLVDLSLGSILMGNVMPKTRHAFKELLALIIEVVLLFAQLDQFSCRYLVVLSVSVLLIGFF